MTRDGPEAADWGERPAERRRLHRPEIILYTQSIGGAVLRPVDCVVDGIDWPVTSIEFRMRVDELVEVTIGLHPRDVRILPVEERPA